MNLRPPTHALAAVTFGAALLTATETRAQTTRVTDVDGVQWFADYSTSQGDAGSDQAAGLQLRFGESVVPLSFDRLRTIRADVDLLAPARTRIDLRNGDRIQTTSIAGSANGVRATLDESTFGTDLALDLPLRRLKAIVFDTTVDNPGLAAALASPPRTEDLLFALDNEGSVRSLTVRVDRFEGEIIHLDFDGTAQQLPFERCVAICFGEERGLGEATPKRPYVRVKMSDGTTLTGKLHAEKAPALGLRTGDLDLVLDPDAIVAIDSWSSLVQSLSNLEPIDVQQTPAFDRIRPWLRGRTPTADGFRLQRRGWSEGFCLIPRTLLTFDLTKAIGDGEFDQLRTTIGIDERSAGPAHAVFRIRLDGEIVFERAMHRGEEAVDVEIPLARAGGGMPSKLTFETDFGETLDLGDHCVFASPRLVREG